MFCGECGAPVTQETIKNAAGGSQPNGNGAPVRYTANAQKKVFPSRLIPILAAAGAAVIVLVVLLIVMINMPKKVDAGKYVKVEFSGGNTVGKASVSFDSDGFYAAVQKARGKDKNTRQGNYNLNDLANALTDPAVRFAENIQVSLDKDTGLSNNDTVTAEITYDADTAKQLKIKLTDDKPAFTVKNLKELVALDPFADLKVSFTGYAPNMHLEMENDTKNELLQYNADYKADKTDGINIGDTITVSVRIDEKTALDQGYKLGDTTKQYKVETGDKFIMSLADISADFMTKMQKDASDAAEAHIAQEISTADFATTPLQYVGAYLQTAKNPEKMNDDQVNCLTLVYSTTVSSLQGGFAPTTVYYPVRLKTITQIASGTQLYNTDSLQLLGDAYISSTAGWGCTSGGYTDGTKMFTDCIVASKDKYQYEMTDGLKAFGQ